MVPDVANYEEPVSLRPNGELVVYQGVRVQDGTVLLEELDRVNLEGVRKDRGGRSSRMTLTGRKATDYGTPGMITLEGLPSRSISEGLRRYRAKIESQIRPGGYGRWPGR